ncbi:hypothetical protein NORO109296_19105 [Nocardiopsis rhodophaea]
MSSGKWYWVYPVREQVNTSRVWDPSGATHSHPEALIRRRLRERAMSGVRPRLPQVRRTGGSLDPGLIGEDDPYPFGCCFVFWPGATPRCASG